MIQYLINASAIWLISLIVFDLWLRRTTHHSYNRAYLVITALMGALLPLYHPTTKAIPTTPALYKPMIAFTEVKQSIATAATIPQTGIPLMTWLSVAYLLGVAVSCAFLAREGLMLLRWYRRADKQRHGNFRIVLTHRNHGPFSLFRCIFISDMRAYTPAELDFIIQHEGVHIHRLHFPDKVLLLVLRCLFWFHPLTWIYYNRLMMIHEYEADDTARSAPRDYADFLIQQQLTGTSPLLAHSFFHSPLKNRIRMLTAKRSHSWRKASHLLALPAIAAFAILWVNNSTAQKAVRKGFDVIYGNNTFEMGQPMMGGHPAHAGSETIVMMGAGSGSGDNVNSNAAAPKIKKDPPVEDAVESPTTITVTLTPVPIKMNGQPIHESEALTVAPKLSGRSQSLLSAIVNGAQNAFNKLSDGKYLFIVYSMIVDESGHVAYYSTSPVHIQSSSFSLAPGEDFEAAQAKAKKEKEAHPITEAVQEEILTAVEQTIGGLSFTPGQLNGKVVISRASITPGYPEVILVKNHHATVVRDR